MAVKQGRGQSKPGANPRGQTAGSGRRSARRGTRHRLLVMLLAPVLVVGTAVLGAPVAAAAPSVTVGAGPKAGSDKADFYDSRQDPATLKALLLRAAQSSAAPKAGIAALRKQLGTQAIVSIDPLTGTARSVSKLDGFLTLPSARSASSIALDYVRANPDVFGLQAAEIARLTQRRDYVDIAGIHHLSFVQSVSGIPIFNNGLQANVTRDGRLINVVGSPVASLPVSAASPGISAEAARSASIKSVEAAVPPATSTAKGGARQTTTFSNGDSAALSYFMTAAGPRLTWQTLTAPTSRQLYSSIVDASSGKVLYRHSLTNSDNGLVWENYPGAAKGGRQKLVNLTSPGWLPNNSRRLAGNVAHVYSDVNDDNVAQASEEIKPIITRLFTYPFTKFNSASPACSNSLQCSWDPATPNSWKKNRAQNGVQLLSFIGRMHDHLKSAPIGFTRAAGNFEAVDGDAVLAESMDGANTANGLPDANHTDNANMGTPPDGESPRMQMYLFPNPADPNDPFLPSNSGDESDIVYHEYTHGLSNRLVVDAMGNSTLGSIQAGSMGEAWSDWYAMDFLTNSGLQKDTSAPGEVRIGQYNAAGQDLFRTQPLDCPVGTTSAACPGTPGAGPGGYTYGDFGQIIGGPEVHTDGEIWGETLWDLRKALGAKKAESVVTRAMELSPGNPSYLDMRNSIVQADRAVNNGANAATIWKVFAHRGMGWFAGAVDGDDTAPIEDFSLPPAANTPTGSLVGTVTDQDAGTPVKGVVVGFGGHASGFPGDYAAITDGSGNYRITGIVAGTYPSVFARGAGFDRQIAVLSIGSRESTKDWALRRDWAALSGGGSVVDFNGPDYTPFGCGPSAAIDQSLGSGWGSDSDLVNGVATPKFVVVKLPTPVDIAELAVDPGNTCGDAGSASTAKYRIATSTNGTTFTAAASGTFTVGDRGRLNAVPLATGSGDAVRYVRFTMVSPQLPPDAVCPGPFSGCDFMDMSELAVYGTPSA